MYKIVILLEIQNLPSIWTEKEYEQKYYKAIALFKKYQNGLTLSILDYM